MRTRILFLTLLALIFSAGTALAEKPRPETSDRPTPDYLVELAESANVYEIAATLGMEVTGQSTVKPSWYFMRPSPGTSHRQTISSLNATPGVVMAAGGAGQAVRRMAFVPNDPYFVTGGGGWGNPGQWYLDDPFTVGLDIGSQGAWSRDITGQGVTIGIVDDSLEAAHPDLVQNYSHALSWDFGQHDPDPSPVNWNDFHGTAVAGLAAARGGNGIGITGAAPRASLAGLRIDFSNQTTQMFVDATIYRDDAIRVKNHSYGIPIAYVRNDATVQANRLAASEGVINVRAAGNQRQNANGMAAAADRTAVTVAALAADGKYAYYSNFGACVFVTAPSAGERGLPLVTTTDLTGPAGYSDGSNPTFPHQDYTNNFGGTSAAVPLVSGVVAQILQVNPSLDVRGIKHILARTSKMVDPGNPEWTTNAAGYHFNPNYGFGLIDADAATQLAATFTPPPEEVAYTMGPVQVHQPLPDGDPEGITVTFDMPGDATLESVELNVQLTHPFMGDIDIVLTSPSGTSSRLAYGYTYAWNEEPQFDWTFSSAAFWGEDIGGSWALNVADVWNLDIGTLDSFQFTGYAGVPEPATLSLLVIGMMALLGRKPGRIGQGKST